jgi:hypothetical protein
MGTLYGLREEQEVIMIKNDKAVSCFMVILDYTL